MGTRRQIHEQVNPWTISEVCTKSVPRGGSVFSQLLGGPVLCPLLASGPGFTRGTALGELGQSQSSLAQSL